MQDMDTTQQSLTSPAQAHDTSKESAEDANLHLNFCQIDTKSIDMKESKESNPNFIDIRTESNQNNETMTELPNIEYSSQFTPYETSDKTDENKPNIKEDYRKIKDEYIDCRDVEMSEIDKINTEDHETADDIEMKYICPICDAMLFSQHDFTLHIRLHNNNSSDTLSNLHCAKGFSCKICSKVLSSSSSLDRHVLVHSGERPFKCRICGVAFTTNGNMHRHMRTHNLENSSSNRGDESDVSSDGGSSSHGSRRSPNSSPPTNSKTKKRKVSDITSDAADATQALSPSQNSFETACNKRKVSESSFSSSMDIPNNIVRRRTKSMTDTNKESARQCPVCERENFVTLNALETHLEEKHPDYKAKCQICDLIFKNHRALNLHRFMTHHETEDSVLNCSAKSKNHKTLQQGANSVLGFRDLTFVDFSSEKFPHIARAVCEKSLHKASSAFHKFQCEKCLRAFPCGSALKIHCKACYSGVEYTTDEFSSSDCDTPTDLSKRRREEEPQFRTRILSDAESEEEQKREDFFAGLDLRNKSALTPDKLPFNDVKQDDRFDNDSYFDVTQNGKFENGRDLADIQSIISVTSATGFLQDLSKSPQPHINDLTPPDSALKLSVVDSGGCEEEQQDCFAAEFRKMKLKGEFPCRLCVLVFPNLRALKGHNRVHLMSGSGIFRCNMCPYSNTDKAVVVRHMRTHNGDRPYECSLCNYAFTTKANCERHLRNRHSKLTREEVRKSIIYHPSEDPINDPEMQGKFSAREDVKRSLVFGSNTNSDDLQDEENVMCRNSLNDKFSRESLTNLSNELMTCTPSGYDKNDVNEEQKKKEHLLDHKNSAFTHPIQKICSKDSSATTRQIRPWEIHEVSTITSIRTAEEIESKAFKNMETGITSDSVHEVHEAPTNDMLICTNKNIANTHQTIISSSQRVPNLGSVPLQSFIKHLGQTFEDDVNCDNDEDVTPLDLSMDALDLSKKKEISFKERHSNNSNSFSNHSESEAEEEDEEDDDEDNNEPQDLSKKKVVNENEKKQTAYSMSPPNSQCNSEFSHTNNFAKQLYSNPNASAIASPHRLSPTLTPKIDVPAGFYASSSHLTSLFMNNNNFAFPGQNAFRLPPYFLPSPHHPLFHPTNMQDFSEMKDRLQKELIRGLQLTSGGTMLDPLTVAASADHMEALHQHTLAEIARGTSDLKVSFSDSHMNKDDRTHTESPLSKDVNEKLITFNNSNKSSNKELQQSKCNKDRESTSVKMVIKNGVLMPKQKQRRYRTERPFACEHCSARFTLRSNMERHIKQQHPQFWSQRQRNNNGNVGPGRRSYAAAITSITNQTQINTPHSQESKSSSESFDQAITAPKKLLNTSLFEGNGNEKVLKRDESNNIELHPKTKEVCSAISNNDCVNKAYISDEVKLAIAQQLKSKLNNPLSNRVENIRKREIKCERGEADEEDDDNDGLIIDEEKDVSGNTEMTSEEITELKSERTESKDEAVVDLASVSRLLDNATTQNRAFQQYFKGTQDGEDEGVDFVRGEGSEEEEEGLVAGSNSEGNNSGSDENRSESDTMAPKEKKKSAYSLAPNRVSCPYCLRKFPWSSSLRRHILTHTGQKPYKCPHCPLLFTTKSNCDRHLLRKHGGQSTSNTNSNSTNETPSNSNPTTLTLSYTMRNVPERPYKCNFCPSSTFSTQSNLKKHMATKHGSGSSPTSPACSISKCVTSGDEFGPMSNLDSHCGMEDCGSEDNEEKMSQESERENLEKNDTQTHSQSVVDTRVTLPVHGSSTDLFVPKPLSNNENHGSSVSSSADLPFKCHLCEGSYPERQEALDHIKEIHPSEFKLLMSKGALETANSEDNNNINHTAGSHDDGNGDENLEQLRGKFPDYANRKVMCAFCLRRFWSAEDLRRHMRTHTGERPFLVIYVVDALP